MYAGYILWHLFLWPLLYISSVKRLFDSVLIVSRMKVINLINTDITFQVEVVLDPLSKPAQQISQILQVLLASKLIKLTIVLNPRGGTYQ